MLESLRNKKILVVVAHPDDELLGLGSSMHRLIHSYNCKIRTVILGEGITSRGEKRDLEEWKLKLKRHKENIEAARKIIGYESVGVYDFPDNRFDGVDLLDIIKVVEAEKENFNPEIIFTHHGGDVNIDHQRTFEAVITAARPMEHESVHTIITFETPSGTEWRASSDPKQFIPNFYIEIFEENLRAKIDGMQSYEFEKRDFPHPRSPEALTILAKQRGITVGKNLVESFMIIRLIA
ncbi:PIG-L deacetylase family protein [Ulvibacterium marinum]|uniref:PIG-L family deacetylase n=1 Tax=Ulvibacterium marinum TaxID=2419782 RepID=A0A3B0CCJ7_9FLAO|nr:PIG-L family deacetylase [Ulvibacterium marinum]RKN82770.1 PIG-L family deacetylase [Ulvibacterium marinum]